MTEQSADLSPDLPGAPLSGLTVLDFGHTVLGPSCGLVLADLGTEVIRIEPVGGDPTRRRRGFGTGYFGYFNRNKRSITLNLKSEKGLAVAIRLIERADILIENFAPGAMNRLGLDYESVSSINPGLIYASLKGFLNGPYGQRLALDEVVQMMSGLAYMTGPSGRPLRAGSSVIDITGGMFAVIGILAALRERDRTGFGCLVESALFESAVFLMGQHLCYSSQTEGPVPPMPERVSAWSVYDLFDVQGGRQIFVGITSDAHWERFCDQAGLDELQADPGLKTNNQRIAARERLMPRLRVLFAAHTMDSAVALCEAARIPFSPVARPEDLFDDPHLAATGGLLETKLPNGVSTPLPRLPIRLDGHGYPLRQHPPDAGQDNHLVFRSVGLSDEEIEELIGSGVTE